MSDDGIPTVPRVFSIDNAFHSEMGLAAKDLVSVGWFYPAYFPMGRVSFLAKRLRESPEATRVAIIGGELRRWYTPSMTAALVCRYPQIPAVSKFHRVIGESAQAYFMGLSRVAVSALVPVVEGILRSMADAAGEPIEGSWGITKKLTAQIQRLLDAAETEGRTGEGAAIERYVMLWAFKEFFVKELFEHTDTFDGHTMLNRHGILHGVFGGDDYGAPINFALLMSVIDLLAFMDTLRISSVSAFSPEETPESQRLSTTWTALMLLASRGDLGPFADGTK